MSIETTINRSGDNLESSETHVWTGMEQNGKSKTGQSMEKLLGELEMLSECDIVWVMKETGCDREKAIGELEFCRGEILGALIRICIDVDEPIKSKL
jgi:NACalpha-BTF3-like transcription factor